MPPENRNLNERNKFVVYKSTIKPTDGKKYKHGDVVELDAAEAKHFNGLGYLRPYIEDSYNPNDYAGRQNITESTTSMAGAVEGAMEGVSEVEIGEPHDPGTKSLTTNSEVRGDPEAFADAFDPTTVGRATRNPVDERGNPATRSAAERARENPEQGDDRDRAEGTTPRTTQMNRADNVDTGSQTQTNQQAAPRRELPKPTETRTTENSQPTAREQREARRQAKADAEKRR